MNELRDRGACIRPSSDGVTHISGVSYGDACWNVMKQWAENEDVDPIVTPRCDPSPRIAGTALGLMQEDIIYEIRSVCYHYSLLLAQSFAVAHVLPPPLPDPIFFEVGDGADRR